MGGAVTAIAIGAAIEVHRRLGPGLMESVYAKCFEVELSTRGVRFQTEVPVSVNYKGTRVACAYRVDFFIEDQLVVELKATDALNETHVAQVLTYLQCMRVPLGLLINFNVPLLKQGIRRIAHSRSIENRSIE